MTIYDETWKDETVSLELEDTVSTDLPYQFDTPTTFDYNGDTYEYVRRYTTLNEPVDLSNIVTSKIYSSDGTFSNNVYIQRDLYLSRFLYDKDTNRGLPGQVLLSDNGGVRWGNLSSSAPPLQTIDVYDEGFYKGTVSRLDFYDGNDPNNLVNASISIGVSDIATITVSDRWSLSSPNIYRMSKVGINTIPYYDLDVIGNTKVSSNLIVGGATTIGNYLTVLGDTNLNAALNVGGLVRFNNTTSSTSPTTGAVQAKGGVGVEGNVNIGKNLTVNQTSTFNQLSTFNLGLVPDTNKGAYIGSSSLPFSDAYIGNIDIAVTDDNTIDTGIGDLNLDSQTELVNVKNDLKVSRDTELIGTLKLDSSLIDINNSTALGKFDYRLSSVGTGVSWRPPGVQTQNAIWVTMDGNDSNSGYLEGDAKRTIGAAASIAEPGDTIFIRSGVYTENNPIGLRTDVSVSGQDLRLVTLVPQNLGKDVFHVRRGCLIENISFACNSVDIPNSGGGAVAFPPTNPSDYAVSGYIAPGPANEGPTGRWKSPYIRNCTNFMSNSIGMKINGDHASANFTGDIKIGADLKCMVCDSFTQYNQNGIGVSITNNGYAQLVSIFTINCNIGIYCDTGGSCDLTNSNSSFGNYGLVAVGLGRTEFTGKVLVDTLPGSDIIGLSSVFDSNNKPRKPYDGQALWFKINLDNYPGDAVGSGLITAPMQELGSIDVIDGGSGFSPSSPPNVIIRDADGTFDPKGPQGIIAEASANINENGQITSIDVIRSGRNYLSTQNIVVDIEGNTGLATAIMKPIYYTVFEATEPTNPTGITTVTFNEFIPYQVFSDDKVELKRISRILTSSHSFEYIGTGTDINTSTPLQGAVPIKANEVVAKDGAQVPYTSTDQKGNFDIGKGIQIDQTTSTIRGRDFSRAIQAEVTPLILALR